MHGYVGAEDICDKAGVRRAMESGVKTLNGELVVTGKGGNNCSAAMSERYLQNELKLIAHFGTSSTCRGIACTCESAPSGPPPRMLSQ